MHFKVSIFLEQKGNFFSKKNPALKMYQIDPDNPSYLSYCSTQAFFQAETCAQWFQFFLKKWAAFKMCLIDPDNL